MRLIALTALLSVVVATGPASAAPWTVEQRWVEAHENFLAGPALRGRGSATGDEAVAAAYVVAQFQSYGLLPPPGMYGYTQTATIVRLRARGAPVLTVGGEPVAGLSLMRAGRDVRGALAVMTSDKAGDIPRGGIVLATSPKASSLGPAASDRHVSLLIVPETAETRRSFAGSGSAARLAAYLDGETPPERIAIATLPAATIARLAAQPGAAVQLSLGDIVEERSTTTNAIGYLPGRDAAAALLLFSAHLDHLGVRADGVTMPGANDDASGTTAVLELAHALAAGDQPLHGLVFVAYGSEEIGEYGSRYFAAHPPVPLGRIAANVEFEMIGVPDPKLPAGHLMMTGSERSDLFALLGAHGAALAVDPYKDENFFLRSDNYQLALKGIVAHTISGWAVTPTYHQPTDTIANLDLPFMTRSIQSLIEPVRWLANSTDVPQWRPGGQPKD